MTTFLLVISLLLNGIAIFAIILLFTRQNRLLEVEQKQKKMEKEMEEVISTFLVEMKAENEAFMERFLNIKQSTPTHMNPEKDPAPGLPDNHHAQMEPLQKMDELTEKKWAQKAGKAFQQQAVKAYKSLAVAQEVQSIPVVSGDQRSASSGEQLSLLSPNEKQPKVSSNEISETEAESDHVIKKKPSQSQNNIVKRNVFVNEILILQKQGYSTEEIAKKLHKGKTEIELLLKMN